MALLATPDESNMRDRISTLVYEIVRIAEVECWDGHDSDAWLMALDSFGDTARTLGWLWEQYEQYQRKGVEAKQLCLFGRDTLLGTGHGYDGTDTGSL